MDNDGPVAILLVDDEALIAAATKAALEERGYKVLTAVSGEKALAEFRKSGGIDLVLMDVNLGPGLDGTAAAAAIMAERDVPVVFLSSHSEPEIVAKTEAITSYGYVVKDSSLTVLDASIKMALKLYRAKKSDAAKERRLRAALEALRAGEARLRTILDHMPIGFAANTIDDGSAVYMNDRFADIYGWPREVLTDVDRFFELVYPGPEGRALKERVLADMASGDPRRMAWDDLKIATRSGERRYISAMNIPLTEQNLMVSTVWDMTRDHEMLEALRASEEKYRSLFESSSEAILLTAPDGRVLAANPAACRLLGRTEEGMRKAGRAELVDQADARLGAALKERDETGRFHGELTFVRGDGGRIPVWVASAVFRDKDGQVRTSMILRDLTGQKKAEAGKERQLAEKELLLREVHHRIRNNIASVGALVSMHLRRSPHPEAAAVLRDALSRINGISVIYDILLREKAYRDVPAPRYLERLAKAVLAQMEGGVRIDLVTEIEDVALDSRWLFALGIIVNELLTNAVKHAFPGREAGRIRLIWGRENGRLALTVEDDGVGLPDGFDASAASGLGFTLVRMLTEQLDGTFSMDGRGGVRSRVEFGL